MRPYAVFAPLRFLIFAVLIHHVATLGINCRGSPSCTGRRVARRMLRSIETIDRGRWFANGEQIACVSVETEDGPVSFCAFLQHTGGAWGSRILELAYFLRDHGCQSCGSVPYYYPGVNDVSSGELTYNFVRKPCSRDDGLCYVTTASAAAPVGGVNVGKRIVSVSNVSIHHSPAIPSIMSVLWVALLSFRWV
jgi:hypothetical protein